MAYRDFLISDYLENIGASLNLTYQPFFNGRKQLTKAEAKEIRAIASVRIY